MECKHKIVYFGVTNIIYKDHTIGAVDLWRCLICKKVFAEEKQLEVLDLSPEVGMPSINDDERWAVLVCKWKEMKERWKLVRIKTNDKIEHECVKKKIELTINDFKIDDDKHWLFIPEEYLNKEVRID
jgi:rubredoxin